MCRRHYAKRRCCRRQGNVPLWYIAGHDSRPFPCNESFSEVPASNSAASATFRIARQPASAERSVLHLELKNRAFIVDKNITISTRFKPRTNPFRTAYFGQKFKLKILTRKLDSLSFLSPTADTKPLQTSVDICKLLYYIILYYIITLHTERSINSFTIIYFLPLDLIKSDIITSFGLLSMRRFTYRPWGPSRGSSSHLTSEPARVIGLIKLENQ